MDQFVWGAATSAYQIEGGRFEGGKGTSIWDTFSDAGRLADPGDVACDHFHRWEEDLDLLAELGVDGYRFSVAWTRIIPDGDGEVNRAGIEFYQGLVEGMVERGIDPYLTLYHWDLPQALQDEGGWANRSTADAFARYSTVIADALGDRVRGWITHNEPWVATFLGHQEGVFAPGIQDWSTALEVGHNILVSHGMAAAGIRSVLPEAKVGIALDCRPVEPASDSTADIEATRAFDGFRNRWFFDPVFGKGYPQDMVERYAASGRMELEPGWLWEGDLDTIASPIDFLGINYYTTLRIGEGNEESEFTEVPPGKPAVEGYTEMGWKIDAGGLKDFLHRVDRDYGPDSILITENGASYSDGPGESGYVEDDRRSDYIELHVGAVLEARNEGVPVDGYFVWSFLDNLEWVQGFSQRFGIVWVDHESQERIPKQSFFRYHDLIDRHRARG